MARRSLVVTLWAFGFAAVGCGGPGPATTNPPGTVQTPCGPVVGMEAGGVHAFLGIPYAAPPIGDLRFRAPAPATCWTSARDATAFGAYCPQERNALVPLTGPMDEDCLFVNVWTPSLSPAAPLAVMVWLHGGGFLMGAGSDPLYDGAALAEQGVVVVTVNYRLGPLGWLALPELVAEDVAHGSTGNYGLLDQIAALEWVRDNVAAFGGDPSQVTIFGESAGAVSVCSLIGSPLADGLYRGAILESGSCVAPGSFSGLATQTVADAEPGSAAFAASLGCSGAGVLACLRSKTAAEIVAAAPGLDLSANAVPFAPVVDGWALPATTRARLEDPAFTPVPMIAGTNRDEGTLFSLGVTLATPADYDAQVRSMAGPYADDLLAIYPASAYASPKAAYDTLLRDILFLCPTREIVRLASVRQPQTFLYQFTQVNGALAAIGVGATHASEIPYVFGNFARPFLAPTAEDTAVYEAMSAHWLRFATSADPNATGAVTWPAFTTVGDAHLEIGTPVSAQRALEQVECDAIAAIPPRP